MFKYYFEQIHNVAVWPIISLAIFFAFFVGLIVWVIIMDKNYITEMENLPMDKTDHSNTSNNTDHEDI